MFKLNTSQATVTRRRIYLLPNLLTVMAMFAGFYAMIASMHYHFTQAAIAIFIAMILDGLDGRVARLTQSQSQFGTQLDSLSDLLSFGVTPAIVLYNWSLHTLGKIGWLVAFLYTVCTALRLARFNVQPVDKHHFQGLSTPMSAALVASIVWCCQKYHIEGSDIRIIMMCTTLILSLLKVSTIRYRSFKDINLRDKVPFALVFTVILVLILVAYHPEESLLAITVAYALSGVVRVLWMLVRKRHIKLLFKRKQ